MMEKARFKKKITTKDAKDTKELKVMKNDDQVEKGID